MVFALFLTDPDLACLVANWLLHTLAFRDIEIQHILNWITTSYNYAHLKLDIFFGLGSHFLEVHDFIKNQNEQTTQTDETGSQPSLMWINVS